jgi:outer membrane protein OmpA-like peptidoglycan-associated protein
MKKVKNKVDQKVDSKIDKEVDKTLAVLDGNKKAASPETTPVSPNSQKGSIDGVKSYSKFDFIPGEKIIYAEDFLQDATGELPLTWNASGKGEVMTIDGKQGKWLRIYEDNIYLSGNKNTFGENYTVEFDLMFFFEPKLKGYVLPGWDVGIFSSGTTDPASNVFLKDYSSLNSTAIHFGYGSYATAWLESKANRTQTFKSDKMDLGEVLPSFNKIVHYSIQVQKTRFRLWIDERKVFDIPRAMNTTDTMNQIFFKLEGSNYKEDEIGLFLSNIKIATGLPDTRHKLIEEGRFSTTGILFDVNTATLKGESYGVLKEVAEAVRSNKGIKINIVGHTDSDGQDAANLELSRKRADAVKAALQKDFAIDASSIETEGKGETQPVSDNKTKEGKAQNRRVEFIKL